MINDIHLSRAIEKLYHPEKYENEDLQLYVYDLTPKIGCYVNNKPNKKKCKHNKKRLKRLQNRKNRIKRNRKN